MENTEFIRLYNEAQKIRDTAMRVAIESSIASAAATKSAMATFRSSPHLKKGVKDSRDDVRQLQMALALRGVDIKVDGKFEKETASALTDFQKTAGLNPTGEADPLTWQHLDGRYNGIPNALASQAVDAAEALGKHIKKSLSKGELTAEASHAIAAEAAAAEAIAAEALQAAEPLSAEPFAAEPLAAEPLAAEPFGAEPLAAEPLAAEPFGAEPLAAEPLAAESLGAEPLAAEPLAAEPLGAEPLAAEPLSADPLGTALNNFRAAVASTPTSKP